MELCDMAWYGMESYRAVRHAIVIVTYGLSAPRPRL